MTKQRQAFIASTLKAEKDVLALGLVYDADEVFDYITAKTQGFPATRPKSQEFQLSQAP